VIIMEKVSSESSFGSGKDGGMYGNGTKKSPLYKVSVRRAKRAFHSSVFSERRLLSCERSEHYFMIAARITISLCKCNEHYSALAMIYTRNDLHSYDSTLV
jgi:hypothetical protein